MKSKFTIEQDVILTEESIKGMIELIRSPDARKRFSGLQKIQQVYETLEEGYPSLWRYQISSLWFDEPDLIPINRQDNPEYYL